MFIALGYYRQRWTGSATQNLKSQVPLIAPHLPQIKEFFPATINVRFESMIIVAGSDCRTPPITWTKGKDGEVFDFVHVRLSFEALGIKQMPALMYVGHWSPHRLDPHKHEFLARDFVKGLTENMEVLMECDRNAVELPYSCQGQSRSGAPQSATTIVVL